MPLVRLFVPLSSEESSKTDIASFVGAVLESGCAAIVVLLELVPIGLKGIRIIDFVELAGRVYIVQSSIERTRASYSIEESDS